MHILLTDILTCPRCGPGFGLIVLADQMADRRVMEGRLGCANCRTEYAVRGGVADLRLLTLDGGPAALAGVEGERPLRLAALSGVGERQGPVMVRGASPEVVAQVAGLLPNANVFGASAGEPGEGAGEGVSWALHEGALPLRDRSLIAALLVGGGDSDLLTEAARTVMPGGHLVLDGVDPEALRSLSSGGWSILLEQEGVAVASRPARR